VQFDEMSVSKAGGKPLANNPFSAILQNYTQKSMLIQNTNFYRLLPLFKGHCFKEDI
jgi:hypothetical protein